MEDLEGFSLWREGKRWEGDSNSTAGLQISLTQKEKLQTTHLSHSELTCTLHWLCVVYQGLRLLLCKGSLGKHQWESPAIKIVIAAQIKAIEEHWKLGFLVLLLKLESSLPRKYGKLMGKPERTVKDSTQNSQVPDNRNSARCPGYVTPQQPPGTSRSCHGLLPLNSQGKPHSTEPSGALLHWALTCFQDASGQVKRQYLVQIFTQYTKLEVVKLSLAF